MVTLAHIHEIVAKGHKVTVVGPSEYHYYSGMGPGMLSGFYSAEDIRFATRHLVEKQGGAFVRDKAVRVDPEKNKVYLTSNATIEYDVVSFNAGSYVPQPQMTQNIENVYSVKPIETLLEVKGRLLEMTFQKKITIAVVGGGASAAEMAGNIWSLLQNQKYRPEIVVFGGHSFMSPFKGTVQDKARKILEDRRISIIEEGHVLALEPEKIIMASGTEHKADFVLLATGVKPSKIFADSDLPVGADNGLLVNAYLQSTEYKNMFGGGDCIYFQDNPLDKVGVYAVRQNPVLYHNLVASLEGGTSQSFDPGPDYLLIFNMGGGQGVFKKRMLKFHGKLAFWIKDYIDRTFMKKFQAIEKSGSCL
jgi:NADH dehydrogenase FAD-containing subunit